MAQLTSQFVLSIDDLQHIVNFDERNSPNLLSILNLRYSGVQGVCNLLRVPMDTGLLYGDIRTSYVSINFQDTKKPKKRSFIKQTLLKNAMLASSMHIGHDQRIPLDGKERIDAYGQNIIPLPPALTVLGIIWHTIKEDAILKVLIFGGVVILILGLIKDPSVGWTEGVAILIAVLLVLTVTAGNDYFKDQKLRKLLVLQSDKKCKVLRNGEIEQISSWDVVVGDIVVVEIGDEIPADGLLFPNQSLVVDESPLTGESFPVKKHDKAPFMFSGCFISDGKGHMVVTSVGIHSSGGKIQQLLNEEQQTETPLQIQLSYVASIVGKLGFLAGIVTFLVLLIKYFAVQYSIEDSAESILFSLASFFVIGVTMVVVAVPEGLPLAVTISLAFSMFKMIKDQCFVRHLRASETMGQATVICTDKTGTLTENKMVVTRVSFNEVYSLTDIPSSCLPLLSEAIAINTTAIAQVKDQVRYIGNATECALLELLAEHNINFMDVRKSLVIHQQRLFNSDQKSMATIIQSLNLNDFDESLPMARLHIKGAPEVIIEQCTTQLIHNQYQPIQKEACYNQVNEWASKGFRTLALAFKNSTTMDIEESEFTLLCLVAIRDPVRPNVPLAVLQCQRAGVDVKMVTGDNMLTAISVAQECHILKDYAVNMDVFLPDNMAKQVVMDGPVFRQLSHAQAHSISHRIAVLSRSSPADKHTLVSILKEQQETVAVTGDGTNDSPALATSDVGFAMGINGTQIAINASDIILLDDNFGSIVNAMKWGRNVMEVVCKFLQFQLSVNLVAILVTVIGSSILDKEPLNTVQLLWVNLIMDTLGALALATDTPSEAILLRSPRRKNSKLLSRDMMLYIGMQTVYQMVVLLVFMIVYPIVPQETSQIHQNTLIFTLFVVLQVGNEITARQLHSEVNFLNGILRNPYFVVIMLVILGVQALMVQFGTFLGTVPLTLEEWGFTLVFVVGQLLFVTMARLILRLKRRAPRKDVEVGMKQIQTSAVFE